jgi:arylsulfatase A-like enzyme
MSTLTRRQLLAAMAGAATTSRPNILMVTTDQQSIGTLSASGNQYVKTPHFDRLAAEGTRFENSWCTSPVCSPSRSSLITGCMPHKTHVVFNGDRLNPEVPTMGEIFRAAGYEAAWVGKWHLPAPSPAARVAGADLVGITRDRGFEFLQFPIAERNMLAFGDFTDRPVAEAAAAFLRSKRSRPFLLGVSLLNPHDICYWIEDKLPPGHPSAILKDIPTDELPPLPANFAISSREPEFVARCRMRPYYGQEILSTKNWSERQWRRYLWTYYRMIERVDHSVGKLLAVLDETGLSDDTIVVATSDHGEGMAAHRWVVKLMLYQETVSVPLVFRWKNKIPAGKVDRTRLASGMDVLPSLCNLAGVRAPSGMHGTPLFSGRPRDSVFAQLAPDTKDASFQGRAVRSRRFKYVSFSAGANPEMLFDLEADPGETRNLAFDASSRAELNQHRRLLKQWMQRTEDGYKPAW